MAIGLGSIGALYDLNSHNHLSHLKTTIHDKRFTLNFGYDVSKNICSLIKEEYKLDNIYSDGAKINKTNFNIDLLVIASPTLSHLQSLELFLQFANPKLILCEKPLADNLENAKRLKVLQKKKIPIVINFMRRSLPLFGAKKSNKQNYRPTSRCYC